MQTVRYITHTCLIGKNKIYKDGSFIFEHVGNAEDFFNDTYVHFEMAYPKFHKMDALCKLGFLSAEILLSGQTTTKKYEGKDIGLVLSNAHSSLDVDLRYAKTIHSGASPALFVYTLPNIVIGEISIRHGFKGENAFFVFKHFDGNFIAAYINSLFENSLIRAGICGWVDILKEDYRAHLMMVESDNEGKAIPFTEENLNKLNQTEHG